MCGGWVCTGGGGVQGPRDGFCPGGSLGFGLGGPVYLRPSDSTV